MGSKRDLSKCRDKIIELINKKLSLRTICQELKTSRKTLLQYLQQESIEPPSNIVKVNIDPKLFEKLCAIFCT